MPTAAGPRHPTADLEAQFEAGLGPLLATLLGVVGPTTADRLRVVLTRAGHFDPLLAEGYDRDDLQGLVDWVVDDERAFVRTADDLVAHVPSLVEGTVLTHALTPAEAERSVLDLGPDLAIVRRVATRFPLVGGRGEVVVRHRWDQRPELARAAAELGLAADPRAADGGSLVGPPGWLGDHPAGGLLCVGLHGGHLAVTAPSAERPPSWPSPLLVEALEAAAGRAGPAADVAEALVLDALAHDPTLLRTPDAPLSVALAAIGLAPRDDQPHDQGTTP